MNNNDKKTGDVDFAEVLGMHGYLFEQICKSVLDKSEITISTDNFPIITSENNPSEIDFIAEGRHPMKREVVLYLVCECKREEPTLKKWLFLKSGRFTKDEDGLMLGIERDPTHNITLKHSAWPSLDNIKCSNVAFRIYNKKGKGTIAEKETIYNSCKQLILNLDAFIGEIKNLRLMLEGITNVFVLPVLITSAPLHFASYDVNDVSIENGRIESEKLKSEEVDYIRYIWYSSLELYNKKIGGNFGILPHWELDIEKATNRAFEILVINSLSLESVLDQLQGKIQYLMIREDN